MIIKIEPFDTLVKTAKEFLGKVISPPLEEIGFLAADQIKFWRFKNQVSILNKAENILKANNLKTRKVSLKVMTPLLEECAMEEDESLQDKWASLIANTVREGSELDTTLYSHILSQLTTGDAELFELVFKYCTTTQKNENVTVVISGGSTLNISELRKARKDIDLQLDNLIRLRLIKEAITYGAGMDIVGLTDLGFRFMFAVKKI